MCISDNVFILITKKICHNYNLNWDGNHRRGFISAGNGTGKKYRARVHGDLYSFLFVEETDIEIQNPTWNSLLLSLGNMTARAFRPAPTPLPDSLGAAVLERQKARYRAEQENKTTCLRLFFISLRDPCRPLVAATVFLSALRTVQNTKFHIPLVWSKSPGGKGASGSQVLREKRCVLYFWFGGTAA